MEKAINRKKAEISDLYKDLHSDKISEYLKNEYYFKQMKEEFNDMDDFEELKQSNFDLGVECRQFVIEYNINHDLMKEKTINVFLKQKSFIYRLSEKPDEEPIDPSTDETLTINNEEEKQMIESARKNKQGKQDEQK